MKHYDICRDELIASNTDGTHHSKNTTTTDIYRIKGFEDTLARTKGKHTTCIPETNISQDHTAQITHTHTQPISKFQVS